MKRLIALLLCLIICLSGIAAPVYAAETKLPFEPGTPGTFWASVFGSYPLKDNIIDRYFLSLEQLEDKGAKILAQEAATKLASLPEGKKCIQLDPRIGAQVNNDKVAYYLLNPDVLAGIEKQMDSFFKALKDEGGIVDVIFDDQESWPSVYGMENGAIAAFREAGEDITTSYKNKGHLYEEWMKAKLIEIEKMPDYQNILRPMLKDAGFVFSENYDLEYINIFPGAIEPRKTRFYESNPPEGAERAYIIFGNVIGTRAKQQYSEVVYGPAAKYYPDVKFSNWQCFGTTGEIDIYDYNANLEVKAGDPAEPNMVGTHANQVVYGADKDWIGWIQDNPPSQWRYDYFQLNGFNQLNMELIRFGDAALSADRATVWVTHRKYGFMGTDYYTEAMFHLGMWDPDPFLFWSGSNPDLDAHMTHLSNIFHQLDELCGFEDRKTLMTEAKHIMNYDDRYVLSGMYAGGKNVWRITPDLYAPGVTMENFLVDEKNPTFRIGNQNIEFPKGSYIYYPENELSQYGYWVISPANSDRPKEWRDNKHNMPGEPILAGDGGLPLGYMHEPSTEKPDEIDLSRSKDRKDVPVTQPDEGEGENTVVEEVVTQTLSLNPMTGEGLKTAAVSKDLPFDAYNHWATHTLANMFALGIMQGTEIGMEPDNQVSRAEFIAMLERILGVETMEYTEGIADVTADDWYADVIWTAVSGGWMELDSVNGKANPESAISRADMCDILVRALTLKETEKIEFADSIVMPAKVKDNVSRVAGIGLIEGYEDGKFRPNGFLTRAETATVFERLLMAIPELFPEEE